MGATVNAAQAAKIAGVSEKTMRAWLAAGKIPGARKVHKPGGPASWQIEADALDGLHVEDRQAGRLSEHLAARLAQLERQIRDVLARLDALEASMRDGAAQQAASHALEHFRPMSSSEPSDLALDALQGRIRSTGPQRRGVGGQDVPPEPGAGRLGHILQEHGVVSESGAVSSYWIAQAKAARQLAGVYTQPSQRNRTVPEYWVLRRDRGALVAWLLEHPNAKAHACDDPECACQGQLPPALGARPEVPTVRRPAVLADVVEE